MIRKKLKSNAKPPRPADIYAGTRLRERRKLCGLSQGELGKAIGVSFQQIQKYENGANRISVSRLEQLSEILKVPAGYFFGSASGEYAVSSRPTGFRDNAQSPLEGAAPVNDDEAHEHMKLVSVYRRIKDIKQRRKALELLKTLADMED